MPEANDSPAARNRANGFESPAVRPPADDHADAPSTHAASSPPTPTCSVAPIDIGPLRVDPPVLQAPMAGFTNYAFRQMVRDYGGAGLLATEMVNAESFVWLDRTQCEHPDRLWGVKQEPRPLAVQMWDNNPERLAEVGARLAQEYQVSVVDLNFGCPVKNVTQRAHSGSYLLSQPDRIGRILERVVAACRPTPVTAKIRLGCSPRTINANEVAVVVEQAGAAALTVHGRTAADMFRGRANWERIGEIKEHLKRIPLIGNGDLKTPRQAVDALRRYPVDAIMIARACLGRPWMFRQIQALLQGQEEPPAPTITEQRECLLRHYARVLDRFGEQRGTLLMRKYACCYAQGIPGARQFRAAAANVSTKDEFYQVVRELFPREGPATEQALLEGDGDAEIACPGA
jgi:tRNA-dihydrouridine synthase B